MAGEIFMRVGDVAAELGVSVSYAYKIIRKLNEELRASGCITIAGRINRTEITARDVIEWQNEIHQMTKPNGESYSADYLKNVHTQLSCIFNHAVKYYGLQANPAQKASTMGSEQPKKMLFWTKDEHLKFIDAMMDKPMMYYVFELLYWCGLREGEHDLFAVPFFRQVMYCLFQISTLSLKKHTCKIGAFLY